VISKPPLYGAAKVITTFSKLVVVNGAAGVLGIYAARIKTSFDNVLMPTELRD
jgi:hypothetical protein